MYRDVIGAQGTPGLGRNECCIKTPADAIKVKRSRKVVDRRSGQVYQPLS